MDDNNQSGAARSTLESIEDKTGLDRDTLEKQVKALQEEVNNLRKSLSDKGYEIASRVSDTARAAHDRTNSTIREYPMTAVLGAAAIGAAIALICRENYVHQQRSRYYPEDLLSELGHRLSSLKSRVM